MDLLPYLITKLMFTDPGTPPGFEIGSPPPTADTSTDTGMMDVSQSSVQFIANEAKEFHPVIRRMQARHEEASAQSNFHSLAEVPGTNNIPPAPIRLDDFSWGLPATDFEVQPHHRDPITFEMVQSSFDLKDEATFMGNFTCCELILGSLHDLLQHFEETHANIPSVRATVVREGRLEP